jgi:hypothetical protein
LGAFCHAACTTFPSAYDIEKLSYPVERITASTEVEMLFPKLSAHPTCQSGPAHFGTLWEWDIDVKNPIQVTVQDRYRHTVQSFTLSGYLSLKTTSNRATLYLTRLTPSKPILDHRINAVELGNDSPLAPLPYFSVDDLGNSLRISGKMFLTK